MRLLFLGTGTSQGIPVLGCQCATCHSSDPKDIRSRSSVVVEKEGQRILIDTSPDLRQQLLTHGITDLDAILFTHEHNDHTAGLDDVRPINFLQQKSIPAYANQRVIEDLKLRYHYVFGAKAYPGSPRVELNEIEKEIYESLQITNLRANHRFNSLNYLIELKTYFWTWKTG